MAPLSLMMLLFLSLGNSRRVVFWWKMFQHPSACSPNDFTSEFHTMKPSKMTLQYRYILRKPHWIKSPAFFWADEITIPFFKDDNHQLRQGVSDFNYFCERSTPGDQWKPCGWRIFLNHKQSSAPGHWFSTGCVSIQKCLFFSVYQLEGSFGSWVDLWFNLRSEKSLKSQSLTLRKTRRIVLICSKLKKRMGIFCFLLKQLLKWKCPYRKIPVELHQKPARTNDRRQATIEDLPLQHLDEKRFRPGRSWRHFHKKTRKIFPQSCSKKWHWCNQWYHCKMVKHHGSFYC